MINLIKKLKKWWNNPCFWGHNYEIADSELRAVAYQCSDCNKIKIQIF